MKILQINSSINQGSSGRIVEDIGEIAINNGFQSFIAYGRGFPRNETLNHIKIGNKLDFFFHGLATFFLDRHGFASVRSTKVLIQNIKKIDPDLIHLHNIHGYYINIKILFEFLAKTNIPVVWTLHDCWSFTGHCAHYENIGCEKWKTQCFKCPKKNKYPASYLIDNSENNYLQKKDLFTRLKNLSIVTPSKWLANDLSFSFLNKYNSFVLHNGVDLNIFKPNSFDLKWQEEFGFGNNKIILGVANIWQKAKGLNDFIRLSKILPSGWKIVLVGMDENTKRQIPKEIFCVDRIMNLEELSKWYSIATVFLNPTYLDTFPTTNLEAMACGTPVITYRTGGSPESIDDSVGFVIEKGDLNGVLNCLETIQENGPSHYDEACRNKALKNFNKEDQFMKYIQLYKSILQIK